MSDEQHLAATIDAINEAPPDHSHAVHQPSFRTLCAVARTIVANRLLDQVPDFGELRYRDADALLDESVSRALHNGAHVFASLSRKPEQPPDTDEVGFTDVWYALMESLDENTAPGRAFVAATIQIPALEFGLTASASNLCSMIERQYSKRLLADLMPETVFEMTLWGAQTELTYVTLIAEQRVQQSYMQQLVQSTTGNGDLEDPTNIAALMATLNVPGSVLPWPEDLVCACGKSLAPAIFCCNACAPFQIEQYQQSFESTFQLRRECCGQCFDGFSCDACGRIYSWQKGVVGTVTGHQLI